MSKYYTENGKLARHNETKSSKEAIMATKKKLDHKCATVKTTNGHQCREMTC